MKDDLPGNVNLASNSGTAPLSEDETDKAPHRGWPAGNRIDRILGVMFSCAVIMAAASSRGVVYTYTFIAQSGANGITGVLGGPSINANGNCVFPAQVSGGQAVFAGNGSANPVDITTSLVGSTRSYGSFLQINSSDVVVAQDIFSGSPPSYFIRSWNADVPGAFTILAKGTGGASVQVPTINDSAQLAYLGFDGNTNYTLYTTNILGPQSFFGSTKLGDNLFRPLIADNGSIVGKLGPGPTTSGSIRVYTNTLASYVDVAVAGTGGQFTSLDSLPGISWDGRVIAFNGSISGTPGIFIATSDNTGSFASSMPFPVVGAANGFSSFGSFSRVAVNTTGLSGIITTYATGLMGNVAYIGTQNGTTGLFVTTFLSRGPGLAPVVMNPTPSAVVTYGQSLTNVSGSVLPGTVSSVSILNPLTSDGKVAFFAQTTTGAQAIVVAKPVALGLDVSHFQNESPNCVTADINWTQVQATGASFVYVKASQGSSVRDGAWPNNPGNVAGGCSGTVDDNTAANVQGATSAGLLVGVYHLAGTGNPPVLGNPQSEARFFLQRASSYIGNGYLPPALDLENLGTLGITANALLTWANSWIAFVQNTTGITPVVYADTSTMRALLNAGLNNQYAQWVAAYDGSPTATPVYSGYMFSNWQFKQYTQTGTSSGITGNGGAVDLDSYNGDLTQLMLMTYYPPNMGLISGLNFGPLPVVGNGIFTFQAFSPNPPVSATVQASADLNNWLGIGTMTFTGGIGTFSDSDAGSFPSRFYRLVMPNQ